MPIRVLVDTNVFIVGFLGLSQREVNVESRVLRQLADQQRFTVLFSNELSNQIRRVAHRVGGKDWAGLLLNFIWQTFDIEIVPIPELIEVFERYQGKIPSEDILIFVTATLAKPIVSSPAITSSSGERWPNRMPLSALCQGNSWQNSP